MNEIERIRKEINDAFEDQMNSPEYAEEVWNKVVQVIGFCCREDVKTSKLAE